MDTALQDVWPDWSWYVVFPLHAEHTRSALVLGAVDSYWPGLQVITSEQVAALLVVE